MRPYVARSILHILLLLQHKYLSIFVPQFKKNKKKQHFYKTKAYGSIEEKICEPPLTVFIRSFRFIFISILVPSFLNLQTALLCPVLLSVQKLRLDARPLSAPARFNLSPGCVRSHFQNKSESPGCPEQFSEMPRFKLFLMKTMTCG